MKPDEWLAQNRGRRLKRPKGATVYIVRALQQGHYTWVSMEREADGKIVNIEYSDVKKMISADDK